MSAHARPIAEGLFTEGADPQLIGARHRETGRIVFPMPEGAEAAHYEAVPLARQGKLWSYTVQGFRPKSPPYAGADDDRSFKPFALGYVELPGQVIVETRIETDAPKDLKIGQPMALCLQTFKTAPNGEDRLTFAFRPMAQ